MARSARARAWARASRSERSVSHMGATSEPKIQVTKQEAHGSSWNANSYHYEEKDYSSWGKKRLNELLDKVETKPGLPITHSGQDFALELKTELKMLEGDAWVNIRKGKKMTCFNYEVDLAFKGECDEDSLSSGWPGSPSAPGSSASRRPTLRFRSRFRSLCVFAV